MEEKIRTMIVEDDPMVMEVNKGFVEATGGFDIVGLARSGTEALELMTVVQPQLVILDIFLPDMDGLQTLAEIRKRNDPIDVILVTAARDSETVQKVFRYGAIDYIMKPFKFERFKNALESYRTLRKTLTKDLLDQEEIDRHLSAMKLVAQERDSSNQVVGDADALPKGLNEITLKQILLFLLKQSHPLSAEEVAEGVGLARVTARRYLDFLAKAGKVKLEIQYGSVGRPINRYHVK
ncbi:response regulator [Ammoniphilus sp. CFH 90114]|uniref:response regulator n=1 Tax=Ammoniphilus sp. CFH 90114 TaxID=2493665 RepID=UPI00100FFC65|nr:response regulator [Ammoniphilus sp. CFH 90114]RXT09041.1 response regulator [Ammoniphilus sp. CFH 90114]